MNKDMVAYYAKRAKEYEKVYFKAERDLELRYMDIYLQNICAEKSVLEIACGTGYWTERVAKTANSLLATDINENMLEIAKSKDFPRKNIQFELEDYYQPQFAGVFDVLISGFVWSHIHLQNLHVFLETNHKRVKKGGVAVYFDNYYVEGSSLPVSETDEFGNTFQSRKLENGEPHLVLKNFPSKAFFKKLFEISPLRYRLLSLRYYWVLEVY